MKGIGVSVFVLRPTPEFDTQVLLLRRDPLAAGGSGDTWSPVAGTAVAGERELDTALRELQEETALSPERVYAAPFFGLNTDPALGAVGRVAVFVAFVAAGSEVLRDAENPEDCWVSAARAADELPTAAQRGVMRRVLEDFVKRTPDEALRVA